MDNEYPDAYTDLFQSAYTRMIRCHKLKLHAIKYVNNHMDKFNTSMNVKMLQTMKKKSTNMNRVRTIMQGRTMRLPKDEFMPFRIE